MNRRIHRQVSTADLMYVKNQLTQEWRDVGRRLGVPDADLQHIELDQSNTKEKIYAMLLNWRRRNGRRATVWTLAEALNVARRGDLAEILLQRGENNGMLKRMWNRMSISLYVLLAGVGIALVVRVTNSVIQHDQSRNTTIVQSILEEVINGTLALMDGARRIEESWQRLSAGEGRHNLVIGRPDPGDRLLYQEVFRKGPTIFGFRTYTFKYKCKPNESITGVVVEDGWDDNTGGDPEKIDGGLDECYVKIKVTSKLWRGMDFSFYVFGHK